MKRKPPLLTPIIAKAKSTPRPAITNAHVAKYTQALLLHPRHLKAFFGRGLALHRVGKAEAALADFTTVINQGGDWAEAYYSRATAHAAVGHDAEAWRITVPRFARGRSISTPSMGVCSVKELGDHQAALDDLDNVLASDPSYSEARYTRATIHYAPEDWSRAIEDFSAFLAVENNHVGAYLLRGLAFHRLGQNQPAVADLSAAMALRPNDGTMYMRRWAVYKAMGETAKAKADWTKGKALMEKAGGQQ